MDDLKATVLALEAVIIALARANPEKAKANEAFIQVYTEMVRTANKTDSNHPGLGRKLAAECNRLGINIK